MCDKGIVMPVLFSRLRVATVTFLAFGCVACAAPYQPSSWMANGYRYHDNTPLSSPAPSKPWLREAARPNLESMGDSTAAWQGAVYEVMGDLNSVIPQEFTQNLNLQARGSSNPNKQAFDFYLRQALLSRYFKVDDTQLAPHYTLVYDISSLQNKDILALAKQQFGADTLQGSLKDMYYLTLDVLDPQNRLLSRQATLAILPHEKQEYKRYPGFSAQPTQGLTLSDPDRFNP
jgi:hypothetical protein